ncbi:Thioredoxin-M [uncultured Clostridium sp.]|uniref:thioredoxin family protein n=1 Tax=Mediterraneibacter massiliensis TaxID=1720300 RepID=UPI00073EB1E7|nr:thioredoxin domain-containing protein [Mediterraneibacter massiliensis]SCG98198.1 Thioredoxin-M [uncultured Clostridium sp.]
MNDKFQRKEKTKVRVTQENYTFEVLSSNLPVLVEFYASWCGKCAMMQAIVEQIAEEYKGIIKVCQMDIDEVQAIASQFEVTTVPTFVLFIEGKPVAAARGVIRKDRLETMIEDYR